MIMPTMSQNKQQQNPSSLMHSCPAIASSDLPPRDFAVVMHSYKIPILYV